MDKELQPYAPHADPATQAFTRLEQEMALLRRAIEHLAAEKAGIVIPDYGRTLAEIARRMGAMTETLAALAAMPALKMTPEAFADRMDMAATLARHEDHAALVEAKRALADTTRDLRTAIGTAATIDAQRRNRHRWGGGGLVAGMLLCSILPGFVARAMPTGWHLPERMAARTMGLDRWAAGERLLGTAEPERWRTVVFANALVQDNRDAIGKCRDAAAKGGKPVRCTIDVEVS
jgi:hypothetical protein